MRPALSLPAATLVLLALSGGIALAQTAKPTAPARAPGSTSAGLISPGDGSGIAALLQSQGYRAMIERDDDGAPRLRSASGGINFSIAFLGCEGAECRAIMFTSTFRLDQPPTAEAINEWNRTRNVGTAYLTTSGQPGLIFFVPMEGGISHTAFDYAFEGWRIALADYARLIGFL